CTYGLQHRAIAPDLLVAVHAHFGCWNSRKGTPLHADMAIAAVDTEAAHVMLVAERNRLVEYNVLSGYIRRANDSCPSPCDHCKSDDSAKDRHARNDVHAAMEDLGHREGVLQDGCLTGRRMNSKIAALWKTQRHKGTKKTPQTAGSCGVFFVPLCLCVSNDRRLAACFVVAQVHQGGRSLSPASASFWCCRADHCRNLRIVFCGSQQRLPGIAHGIHVGAMIQQKTHHSGAV